MSTPLRRILTTGTVATLALGLGACSTSPGTSDDGAGLDVLASFYPLQFASERVGADAVVVSSLTPAGAEPHDLELSPAQVRAVGEADVVVFLSGFQPAVDEAVAARAPEHLVDAADSARLVEGVDGHEDGDEGEEESDHGSTDPHFWLDPLRLADVAGAIAAEFTAADPENAQAYATGLESLKADLAALDAEFTEGLASCETRTLVTTHDAFGYLAERYDLDPLPISGLDPEAEPSPARLREVAALAQEAGATTIFTETLVSPRVAEVLASDLGLATAVLDPVEGITDPERDYLDVMRANLEALRTGLRCA